MQARQEAGPVLVVDDEESVRSLLGLLVQRAGAEAIAADSVAEARRLAAAHPGGGLALAIVDKNLPDGSGLDLLRWLRESAPEVPVMVVTGYGSAEAATQALRLGAFDYLLKPFEVAWVGRRIAIALEHRRMRDQLARAREALAGGGGLEAVAAALGG
jgi:two-component system response regulator PilR (NtrC family)